MINTRFTRIVLASAFVGVVVGLVVAGFERLTVEVVFHWAAEQPLWLAAILPALGLAVGRGLLRLGGPDTTNATSDDYVRAFHERTPRLPLRQLPAKLAAGVVTVGSGAALGLEGPAIHAGATVGEGVESRLRRFFSARRNEDPAHCRCRGGGLRDLQGAGNRCVVRLGVALPGRHRQAGAAAGTHCIGNQLSGVRSPARHPPGVPDPRHHRPGPWRRRLARGALIGLAAGLGGAGTSWCVRRSKELGEALGWWQRIVLAGVLLAGLAVAADALFDEPLTLGPGLEAVEWLGSEDKGMVLIALLFGIRLAATLVSIVGGGTGGLFIPLAVQGVIMGSFIGHVIGEPETSLYPTLGLAAFLGAGYRTPIAAVMFVAETTGGRIGATPYVVPALIAAAMSQLVAGRQSVAAYQRSVRLGHLEQRFTLPITSALETDVLTVPPDATVSEFMFVHVLGRRERTVAVVADNRYLGMCDLKQLAGLDRSRWDEVTVEELMDADTPVAKPSWTLRDAVAAIDDSDIDVLPVADETGYFVGVITADAIVRLDEILDETGG